jgi:hypothetical protein
VVVWNSAVTGTIDTVKLLLLTNPKKAKKQMVRYVEYFSKYDQFYVGVSFRVVG